MDDMQRDPRVAEDIASPQESRPQAASAAPVARLLANPRRVRRA